MPKVKLELEVASHEDASTLMDSLLSEHLAEGEKFTTAVYVEDDGTEISLQPDEAEGEEETAEDDTTDTE